MKIHLHIERLILEGLPMERLQGGIVQGAVVDELSSLLASGGLSPELRGGAVPAVNGGNIALERHVKPAHVGKEIARAVYGGIGERR